MKETRDPFCIPAVVTPHGRVWSLWAWVTHAGELLGFAATKASAESIPSRLGQGRGAPHWLAVREVKNLENRGETAERIRRWWRERPHLVGSTPHAPLGKAEWEELDQAIRADERARMFG